ncbi:AI-2E family transporter [Clostridium omnivorum]|uniref:AI-2E family transporter n=1 Tax=Clostridium omnivorum TaxID=1604902 RepID=A0ABQ5NBQ7_9CLOT|nr:AI-2E family transporter [Clostridium sp. E14]GLC32497.1 AI-2E family transporter [Clostridium sp. E14]
MIDKIKSKVNKKYTTICAYIIITSLIIFILARATFEIGSILKAVTSALKYIGRLLTPVFVGIIIAYIINPLVVLIERLLRKVKFLKFKNDKKYRNIAVFVCMVLIILVVFLLIGTFIFSITKQFSNMKFDKVISVITSYINGFSDSLINIEAKLKSMNIESRAAEQYVAQISKTLINWLNNFADNLAANTMNISGYISNFVFGLIIAIYLLLDKDEFIQYGNKFSKAMFSERTEKKVKKWLEDLDQIFSGYIRGTLLDALFICVTLSITLGIIGIKFGVLIGIIAGFCHLVPYFGPIVAFIGTVIFGLLNGQYTQVIVAIIVLFIIIQIDANIIAPKLLGSSVSLKPVFILISIIIGAELAGVLGMVLAVPVTALIRLILKKVLEERIKKKEFREDENKIKI